MPSQLAWNLFCILGLPWTHNPPAWAQVLGFQAWVTILAPPLTFCRHFPSLLWTCYLDAGASIFFYSSYVHCHTSSWSPSHSLPLSRAGLADVKFLSSLQQHPPWPSLTTFSTPTIFSSCLILLLGSFIKISCSNFMLLLSAHISLSKFKAFILERGPSVPASLPQTALRCLLFHLSSNQPVYSFDLWASCLGGGEPQGMSYR